MSKPGPKSEAGKAVVRLNAVRHGVLSTTPVIPGLESQEDWEDHSAGVMASLAPEGQLETALAERVALTLWRLKRVARYETGMIVVGRERAENDFASSHSSGAPSPESTETAQASLRLAQKTLRLLERLPDLSDDASIECNLAAEALVTLIDCTRAGFDLEVPAIPGVPDDVDWEDFDGWTGGLFRQAVRVIAACDRSSPEKLVGLATAEARERVEHLKAKAQTDVQEAEARVQEVAAELDRLRREHLLPDDSVLLKVVRYESHLNRQLYQALHELEALQAPRRGEQTPLARLDVQGLAGE
jgi:hypothetical protein